MKKHFEAKVLQTARMAKGLTCEEVANELGISVEAYMLMETSLTKTAKRMHKEQITRVLGIFDSWQQRSYDKTNRVSVRAKYSSTEIANRLKFARERRGVSKAFVARHLEINYTTYSRWERHFPHLSLEPVVAKLEQLVDVPQGWLFGGEEQFDGNLIEHSLQNELKKLKSKTVRDELIAVICWISVKDALKRTVHLEDLTKKEKELFDLLDMRFGITQPPMTIVQISEKIGKSEVQTALSMKRLITRLQGLDFDTPCMDRSINDALSEFQVNEDGKGHTRCAGTDYQIQAEQILFIGRELFKKRFAQIMQGYGRSISKDGIRMVRKSVDLSPDDIAFFKSPSIGNGELSRGIRVATRFMRQSLSVIQNKMI